MEGIQKVSVPVVRQNQGKAQVPIKRPAADSAPAIKAKQISSGIDQQLAKAEMQRMARVKQAANSYAISDQRFTIYKDTTGQLITRFTSLRDGKVTYLPEPSLLTSKNNSVQADPSLSFNV